MIRQAISLITALAFFGATVVGISHGITLGSVLSLISGSGFLLGTLIDLSRREPRISALDEDLAVPESDSNNKD